MNSLRIHYFKHVPFEGLGYIEQWSREHGHQLMGTHFWESFQLPELGDLDWLIVMGGPMGVYEEEQYPWLGHEKEFIRRAIDAGKIVLGICLGSQLVASALGARVYPSGIREIGWYPLQKTASGNVHPLLQELPETFTCFQWHGDTFDLPEGAVHLLRSDGCTNQAFLIGEKVLGLQFHLEVTPANLTSMMEHCRDELQPEIFVQSEEDIRKEFGRCPEANGFLGSILDRLSLSSE